MRPYWAGRTTANPNLETPNRVSNHFKKLQELTKDNKSIFYIECQNFPKLK